MSSAPETYPAAPAGSDDAPREEETPREESRRPKDECQESARSRFRHRHLVLRRRR